MPDNGISPGQVLDRRYQIERRLGKGGVGQVYLGRHQRTGRPCAIKLLSAEGGLDQSSLRRFEREARTLGSLGHPGIVGIHDFSETPEGVPYLVMDYLDGEDLAQRLRRDGAMEWETARRLFREMAHALHAAHSSGVLHRDLKPGNVYLARTPGAPDRAVLLDFGLAKAEAAGLEELSLTRTGAIFGTPLYMSPEQARGDRLDQRSDIYSLATILFEMLAGRPPFVGANLTQLVSRLLLDPVPVLSDLAEQAVPAHLDGVLGIALGKAPEERYPSVVAFAEAVLEEPLAEAWAQPTLRVPETLLATLPSEPPHTGPPGESAAPGAPGAPRATAPAQPAARRGPGPEDDGGLANQVTLESGDPLIRPKAPGRHRGPDAAVAGSSPEDRGLPLAKGRATADDERTPRRGATSWMLHLGIFLLGMAATAVFFWLVLARGPATGPGSQTPAPGASAAGAPGAPGPRGASGERDATPEGARDSAVRLEADATPPRADVPAPDPPVVGSAVVAPGGARPRRRPPPRPGLSRPRPEPRRAPARAVPGAMAPAVAPPRVPPLLTSSFGKAMFDAGQIRGKAVVAERQGKGRECLTLLDQADRVHPQSGTMYHYLRGWCLMRVGRCAAGKRLLQQYYQQIGVAPGSSKPTIQWAENSKCPATAGSPGQQLVRLHQQLTTACAMGEVTRCGRYARLLQGLIPKLARPLAGEQKTLLNQGFVRAGVGMAKAGRCSDAWRYFQRSAAVYLGASPRAQTQAEQHMRIYAKGCPSPVGGP